MVYELIYEANSIEDNPSLLNYDSEDSKGFNLNQLNRGIPIKDLWREDITFFVEGAEPVDFILCSMYCFLVSSGFRHAIEDLGVLGVEFLQCNIVHKNTLQPISNMYVINVINCINCIDEANTNWIKHEIPKPDDPYAHIKIIKPALKKELIEEYDIFHITYRNHCLLGIYISNNLHELLEKNGTIRCIEFMPVKIV